MSYSGRPMTKIIIGSIIFLMAFSIVKFFWPTPKHPHPYDALYSATKIMIEEDFSHTFYRGYNIWVDDLVIGRVEGKTITAFGDVFTLTMSDGTVLAYEKEHKKFFKLNRSASVYDSENRLTGYIGEEYWEDLFSWSYVFHFYDRNKNEIGTSKKLGKSVWNDHDLYGASGSEDYSIDKKWDWWNDTYVLEVKNPKSTIPMHYAILLVCIEDAIGDAHE